jgi:hypothetical protein
MPTVIFTNSEF